MRAPAGAVRLALLLLVALLAGCATGPRITTDTDTSADFAQYRTFAFYNVTGAVAWVGICLGAGYLFGNIPVVKENFELVVLGIVGVSVLPILVEFVKMRRAASASRA